MTTSETKYSTIVDLTTVCNSFPEIPNPEVIREVVLDTIDDLFSKKNIVIVEGKEGTGKTTLLAQFAKRYPKNAISLFIRPANRYSYNSDIFTLDLGNQIEWILQGRELEENLEVSESQLRKYCFALGRRAHKKQQTYFFVIDGLFDIPDQEGITLEQIYDLLPIGNSKFKFLLSGRADDEDIHTVAGEPARTYLLGGFSLEETKFYFSDFKLDKDLIEELHIICVKNPGYLASARRILESGKTLAELLANLREHLPNLFEIEWQSVKDSSDEQLLLSIIAHDTRQHSMDVLAYLADMSIEKVTEILSAYSFINLKTDGVSFISEAMRRFAVEKVPYSKDKVIDLIINKILEKADDDQQGAFINNLPSYLYEGGKLVDLINYLSNDYFSDALLASQSMSFIQKMASLGIETAKKLNDEIAFIRFSIYSSIIFQLGIAETWRTEVEALMELNDYDAALSLAQSAKLKEDRLHLLAVIALKKRENDEVLEPELIEQMRSLYSQIDYSGLSNERATEIARDLLHSLPDVAIEIIEKSQKVADKHDSLDWALARLSFAALMTNEKNSEEDGTSEKIRSRIKNPKVKKLSEEMSLMLHNYSSKQILSEIEKLDTVTDKLYMLRHWTVSNRDDENTADVIEYAIQLTIQSTSFTPNAQLFRELASPLPYIKEADRVKVLIGKFDSQLAFCEKYGPTDDFVRLQLILAHSESNIDLQGAENRIIEVYYYVSNIQDYMKKAECLSRLVAALRSIDQPEIFEDKHGLYTVTESDLQDCFEKLLTSTANQYIASERIIFALAKKQPQLAMQFALSLNTQTSRDEAISNLVSSLLHTIDTSLNLASVASAISQINDIDLRDDTLLDTLMRLSQVETKSTNLLLSAKPLLELSKSIRDASMRCRAICYAIQFHLSQEEPLNTLTSFDLLKVLEESLLAHDIGWAKVDTGFRISQSITKYSLELGKHYLKLSQQFKNDISLYNQTLVGAYTDCLRIAIIAYSGLISNNIDKTEDFDYLSNLISRLPSHIEQAEFWSEIALHHFLNKRTDTGREIVGKFIRPLIDNVSTEDGFLREEIISIVSPSLYIYNYAIAQDIISKLTAYYQNKSYIYVCEFFLRKRPPSDPYDLGEASHEITYDDAIQICEIIPKLVEDSTVYYYLKTICESISFNRSNLNRNQIADIVQRLENIVDNCFPKATGIQHEGYKIVSTGQIYRIKKASTQNWQDLMQRARNLPNLADRAYVLSKLADTMPSSRQSDQQKLLVEAEETTEKIPSMLDRAEHYETLAANSIHVDIGFSRRMINLAMKTATSSDDVERSTVQRRIVDFAYRIDPEFANSLSAIVDDDRARVRAKALVEDQINTLKQKQALTSGEKSVTDKMAYVRACNMYLAGLNAGRAYTLPPNAAEKLLAQVSDIPLSKSYSILALITQNFVKRFARDKQGGRYIRPYFDVSLLSAQLVENIAVRVLRDQAKNTSKFIISEPNSNNLLVSPGEKDEAKEFLKDWLSKYLGDYLIICDGYFGIDELELIQLVGSINSNCEISILTSAHHQKAKPWSEAYKFHWRLHISDFEPPPTTIVVAGLQGTLNSPIHDRWWLTDGSGLHLGTSMNGLGKRSSDLIILDAYSAQEREAEVRQYLSMTKRTHEGERISYESFNLLGSGF